MVQFQYGHSNRTLLFFGGEQESDSRETEGSSNRTLFPDGGLKVDSGVLGCILSNGTSTVGKRSGGCVMNFGFY